MPRLARRGEHREPLPGWRGTHSRDARKGRLVRPKFLSCQQADMLLDLFCSAHRQGKAIRGAYYFNQFDAADSLNNWADQFAHAVSLNPGDERWEINVPKVEAVAAEMSVDAFDLENVILYLIISTPQAIAQYVKRLKRKRSGTK